jgi:hypothetical protein
VPANLRSSMPLPGQETEPVNIFLLQVLIVLFPVHFRFKCDMSEHVEDLVRPVLHQNRRCIIADTAQQRAQNLARIRDNQRMPLDDAGCIGSV